MASQPYEPQGTFVGVFTQAELETMLGAAKKVFLEQGGAQLVNWSTTGMTVTKRIDLTALEMIAECVHALRYLDPETYPVTPDQTTVQIV